MRRTTRLFALPVVAVLSFGFVGPAGAHTQPGWEDSPDSDPDTVKACGTTLTISPKIDEVEQREVPLKDGTIRTDYRGRFIVKVVTADHRWGVFDNSGPYSLYEYVNGALFFDIDAPGLIYPFDAEERSAFKEAGLPPVFYFKNGELKLYINAEGEERVLQRPKHVTSVCGLLQ